MKQQKKWLAFLLIFALALVLHLVSPKIAKQKK